MKCYRQISDIDRVKISRLKASGLSNSEIARRTGFDRSTIGREFKRNSEPDNTDEFLAMIASIYKEEYVPQGNRKPREMWTAESAAKLRKFRAYKANQIRRRKDTRTLKWVVKMLKQGWTPDQISGRSEQEGYSYISYECIYNYIAFDRRRGGRLFTLLKRFGKRKSRTSSRIYGVKGQIPGRVFIDKRPKIVERRTRLGDLEADLIVGRNSRGYLLTLVDRVSRRVVLKKLKTKSKTEVFVALRKAITEMKIAKTLTVDNGKEFASHRDLTRKTGVRVFFTRPYTSHEKGTVENTNGLIRHHFPSETAFNRISEQRIKQVEVKLNSTPRKVLNYLTPNEVHNRKMRRKIATNQCCT